MGISSKLKLDCRVGMKLSAYLSADKNAVRRDFCETEKGIKKKCTVV
jgi:hypothetical protein